MNKRISPDDWERLSAYLDDELEMRQRARLEAALAQDDALRQALEKLRRTKSLLAALPMEQPRRSFVLTPQMVGASHRRVAWLSPLISWAAVAASLLFVVLLWRDVLVPRAMMPALQAAPEVVMEKAAEAPAEDAEVPLQAPQAAPAENAEEETVFTTPVPTEFTPGGDAVEAPSSPALSWPTFPPAVLISGVLALVLIVLAAWIRRQRW